MVKGPLGGVESLKQAFSGSFGVFGVTDFLGTHVEADRDPARQEDRFDPAKAAGVEHLVFSTLGPVEKLSSGKYKHVDHFDGKAEIEDYAEANKGDMVVSYSTPGV